MSKWSWVESARCASLPDDVKSLFFSYERKGSSGPDALIVDCCRRCPVREKCREHALGLVWPYQPEKHGYWGGTTREQRRKILAELGLSLEEDDG